MLHLIRQAADWFQGKSAPEELEEVVFALTLDALVVGFLRREDKIWVFEYSDDFRNQDFVKPIMDFPDPGRKYSSKDLWPFFTLRIPSLAQTGVQQFLREQEIEDTDEITMLKKFGRRSVANPFELQPA